MSKEALARRVLADPHVEIYPCGRDDIRSGQVDRRVLATLEFLAASGLEPDGHVAQVRPQLLHDVRQRLGALVGQRGRHRRRSTAFRSSATRAPARSPSSRSAACSRSRARSQPHQIISLMDMGGPTLVAGRPRRSHPRRLPAAVRLERKLGASARQPALEQPVGQAGRRDWATSATRSCARSRRSTRSRSSAPPREPRTRATSAHVPRPATASQPSSSASASSTSASRWGRRTVATWCVGVRGRRARRGRVQDAGREAAPHAARPARPPGDRSERRRAAARADLPRVTVVAGDAPSAARRGKAVAGALPWRRATAGVADRRGAAAGQPRHTGSPCGRRRPLRPRGERAQARRVRVGYGTGDELDRGALERGLRPPVRGSRAGAGARCSAPQEEVAGILGDRRRVTPARTWLLRAGLDLDQERIAQAALQLAAALEALAAEVERDEEQTDSRLTGLLARRATPRISAASASRSAVGRSSTPMRSSELLDGARARPSPPPSPLAADRRSVTERQQQRLECRRRRRRPVARRRRWSYGVGPLVTIASRPP